MRVWCPGGSVRRGRLFVIEGIDGTGKSTQVAALAAWLRGLGLVVHARREPTMGPHGQALRASATTGRLSLEEELRLLELDRREHVEQVIGPALAAGEVVVLDRYYFSTAAYQGARGADPEAIVAHHETFAPRPDLTLVLDLDPEESRARIALRGELDAFEGLENLRRCRDIFLSLLADDVRLVDARPAPETVTEALVAQVRPLVTALSPEPAADDSGSHG